MGRGRIAALLGVALALSAATGTLSARTPWADSAAKGQALLAALREADEPLALRLLDEHAQVNCTNAAGETALLWAAQRGYTSLARRLLKAGADPTIRASNGIGPLQVAIANKA